MTTGITFLDRWLNSSALITSDVKFLYPAALASSGACNITLVEPPTAMETIMAFLIDSLVTMSRGLMSFLIILAKQSINSSGN